MTTWGGLKLSQSQNSVADKKYCFLFYESIRVSSSRFKIEPLHQARNGTAASGKAGNNFGSLIKKKIPQYLNSLGSSFVSVADHAGNGDTRSSTPLEDMRLTRENDERFETNHSEGVPKLDISLDQVRMKTW